MTENFPNLVKEIDKSPGSPERVPDKVNLKRPTPRLNLKCIYILLMPKIKDKERILKAAKEKKLVTY